MHLRIADGSQRSGVPVILRTIASCEAFLNYFANGALKRVPGPSLQKALVGFLRKGFSKFWGPEQQDAG